jgi:RimJ/RimL family protein N-acetyltransferase
MKIRLATKKDLNSLAKIYVESFNNAKLEEEWTEKNAQRYMEYWLKIQPSLFFIAEDNKTIVGGIVARITPWWKENILGDIEIFISLKHQNKGIGKELLKKLISTAIEKYKIGEVALQAFSTHKFPLKWYEKIGFKKIKWINLSGNPKEIIKKL